MQFCTMSLLLKFKLNTKQNIAILPLPPCFCNCHDSTVLTSPKHIMFSTENHPVITVHCFPNIHFNHLLGDRLEHNIMIWCPNLTSLTSVFFFMFMVLGLFPEVGFFHNAFRSASRRDANNLRQKSICT